MCGVCVSVLGVGCGCECARVGVVCVCGVLKMRYQIRNKQDVLTRQIEQTI